MDPNQITLIKQINVPTFDFDLRLILEPDKLLIQTKPYGHGTVHNLLYSEKVVENWQKNYNTKWLVFFQDTNLLIFKSIIVTIGVSKELNLEMNSVGFKIKLG